MGIRYTDSNDRMCEMELSNNTMNGCICQKKGSIRYALSAIMFILVISSLILYFKLLNLKEEFRKYVTIVLP